MIIWILAAACAQIAPEPLSAEIDAENRFEVDAGTYVVFTDEATASKAAWFDELRDAAGVELRRTTASRYRDGEFAFYIGVATDHASFRERRLRRWLDDVPGVGVQGYRLLIDRRGIVIAGTDDAGVRNGVAALLQLFGEDGSLPQTRVRDEPEIEIRAIRLPARPDADQIRSLANARCTLAIIESPDFWRLNDQTAAQWRETFTALRAAGIEPVPAIDPMADATPLLARFPSIGQTQMGIDQLVLADDSWTALSHQNVVDSPSAPIRVRAGGAYFEAGRDFVAAPPRARGNSSWHIRRVADGAIPPGESVDVLYSYVGPETRAANPLAPEYPEAIRQVLAEIDDVLNPRYLHIGHTGHIATETDEGARDPFAESLKAFTNVSKGKFRLMAFADAFRDLRSSRYVDLLPRDAILDVGTPYGPPPVGPAGTPDTAWARNLDRTLLISASPSPLGALATCESAARTQNIGGIAADNVDVVRLAWSPTRSALPWPRVLNAYFGSRLWNPGAIEAFEALAAHANEQTVRGVRPETELETFRTWFENNRDRIPANDAEFVEGHYTRILEWVRLESEFRRGDGRNTLRELIGLVQQHAAAIPEYPEERRSTIVHTIDSAGRFVPSNILFGTPVLAYRAINIPGSYTVLEVPARPEFSDHQGATDAQFDLLESPGPILRIDFDTLNPSAMAVERSFDGKTFETVQQWSSNRSGPPLFLQRPFSAAAFRVTVEGNPPVLREPRVFALKDVPAAICSQTVTAPELDGRFRERGWPAEAQIAGFVETTQARFAAVATTVRVTYTRNALYLGVYAREPRMDTLVSEMTRRDGPLWNEEAIDVRLGIGNDEFIFAVNPKGAQFDSRNDDARWNGAWSAQTRLFTTGWSAEVALPFETLGKRPRSGEDWQLDIVRYRHNVEQSTSHWAYRPGTATTRAPGRLIFN